MFLLGRSELVFGNMFVSNDERCFCFGKTQRLLNANDFKVVFDNPSFKVHQANILFFVKMREPIKVLSDFPEVDCRLGLAITKKKIKRANERNRLKRLVREQFRLCQHDFGYVCDVVVIVKIGTQSLTNAELLAQIQAGFEQVIHKANRLVSNSQKNS